MSEGHRVINQSHKVKVKVPWGFSKPLTRKRQDMQVFSFPFLVGKGSERDYQDIIS